MTEVRYFKVSPRGFSNEVLYFRVPSDKVAEVEQEFAGFEDHAEGGYCGWTNDKVASMFGVAVEWEDRHWVM